MNVMEADMSKALDGFHSLSFLSLNLLFSHFLLLVYLRFFQIAPVHIAVINRDFFILIKSNVLRVFILSLTHFLLFIKLKTSYSISITLSSFFYFYHIFYLYIVSRIASQVYLSYPILSTLVGYPRGVITT